MLFRQLFDPKLAQYAYLVGCQQTKQALIIDPERDIDRYVALAEREGLEITAIAETHIHADFLSGARNFAVEYGTTIYLSDEGDSEWKYRWIESGEYDVVVLQDGDTFHVGNIEVRAVHTPGHTPEHLSFLITDHGGGADEPMGIVTGDFVFVGDLGRPDLLESAAKIAGMMKPAARQLYKSAHTFLELPDFLQVWPGHGAGSACGKALGAVPESTVGYERRFSPALEATRHGEDAFLAYILEGQPEPPLYFARMKHQNRDGVPLADGLPAPKKLSAPELAALTSDGQTQILDTRTDRTEFGARHIPDSLHTPFNKTFNTFVGSLVEDEATPICLIIDDEQVEQAVRDLFRIGFDNIVSYASVDTLNEYFESGRRSKSIEVIDFDQLERERSEPGVVVFDARNAWEYREGHIHGAVNASYTRLPEYEPDISNARTFLVHCASGLRAAAAASYLARSGREVKIVNDEFSNYASSYETESEEAEAA